MEPSTFGPAGLTDGIEAKVRGQCQKEDKIRPPGSPLSPRQLNHEEDIHQGVESLPRSGEEEITLAEYNERAWLPESKPSFPPAKRQERRQRGASASDDSSFEQGRPKKVPLQEARQRFDLWEPFGYTWSAGPLPGVRTLGGGGNIVG